MLSRASHFSHLQTVRKTMFGKNRDYTEFPYIMLQVRMKYNREVKLEFLGGQYKYFMSCDVSTVTKSLPGHSNEDIIFFAAQALHDECIVDGLVRVDIFSNNEGNLVVNELESLEARWFTRGDTHFAKSETFLQKYWGKYDL